MDRIKRTRIKTSGGIGTFLKTVFVILLFAGLIAIGYIAGLYIFGKNGIYPL